MLMLYVNWKCKIYVLNVNLCFYFLVSAVASFVSFCTWIWFSCCPCFGCIVENGFVASDWRIQCEGLTCFVLLQCPYFQICTFVYNIIMLLFFFFEVWSTVPLFFPPFNCRSYSLKLISFVFYLGTANNCETLCLQWPSYSSWSPATYWSIWRTIIGTSCWWASMHSMIKKWF